MPCHPHKREIKGPWRLDSVLPRWLTLCALGLPARGLLAFAALAPGLALAQDTSPEAAPAEPAPAEPVAPAELATAPVAPAEAPSAPASPPPAPSAPAAAPAPAVISPASPVVPAPVEAAAPEKSKKGKGKKGGDSDRPDDFQVLGAMNVGARLMAGYEYDNESPAGAQTDPASETHGFAIRQIRLNVEGTLAELFRINTSFELADALDPETGASYTTPPYLRTATIEYRPMRELRVRVGRYKRPFSHLELESASDLPILRRGLFNSLALEDNQWGDRAVGMMVSGRVDAPKLRWYLSLTNPAWSTTIDTEGIDVFGRVEWTIVKGLVLGANGGYKNIELGQERLHDFGYGGDLTLKLGDAHFLLESNDVALQFETGRPRALGVLFMFDYELGLTENWSLQPTFFAEYADANTEVTQNESLRLVFALNVLAYRGFRIMPQVDLVRSIGDTSAQNPWLESETLSLIFSLVL